MHKWISEESKCMRGSIKHFREHLRWKLLLGGAFFALFANMFEWRWGFRSIRTVCALFEYSATEYYDGSRGCKWNPTQYLELAALVKILHPLEWVLTCSKAWTGWVSHCQLHWLLTFNCQLLIHMVLELLWHTLRLLLIWCCHMIWDRLHRFILFLLSL